MWLITAATFATGLFLYLCIDAQRIPVAAFPAALIAALAGSIPGFVVLWICLLILRHTKSHFQKKLFLFLLFQFIIAILYGLAGTAVFFTLDFDSADNFLYPFAAISLGLFACTCCATTISIRKLAHYFLPNAFTNISFNQAFLLFFNQQNKTIKTMETLESPNPTSNHSNRILVKGFITGGLILLMLIPTLFIQNLISERQQRQKEVVKEVSSKWASAQNLSGPFLTVPYTRFVQGENGKIIPEKTNVILLPQNLKVQSEMTPEKRTRSIYNVLLYKSNTDVAGVFNIKIPKDIDTGNLDFANAKLCIALSDFMGIEEEVNVNFNGEALLLNPGLPANDFGDAGLSVPIKFSPEDLQKNIPFQFNIKLKGSEQLHFMPLSATARFKIKSTWPSPSFDGNLLPASRSVSDKGFEAEWNFNQANLPFGTVIEANKIKDKGTQLAFGVSLVQPASQYDKTSRSVKYALLFIGLTFAFFFIIELMQRKPFHPVQYVLVGLALVIFYTLLLSISEYILFDYAYLMAALATILLITFYAKGHFRSWKTAGIFFGLLSGLYGFIFVLISLEDTALIVGSVGLFIILAIAMYASRKINWYGNSAVVVAESAL
jgi:inner membrane protein